jgi:hypothetical protein
MIPLWYAPNSTIASFVRIRTDFRLARRSKWRNDGPKRAQRPHALPRAEFPCAGLFASDHLPELFSDLGFVHQRNCQRVYGFGPTFGSPDDPNGATMDQSAPIAHLAGTLCPAQNPNARGSLLPIIVLSCSPTSASSTRSIASACVRIRTEFRLAKRLKERKNTRSLAVGGWPRAGSAPHRWRLGMRPRQFIALFAGTRRAREKDQ